MRDNDIGAVSDAGENPVVGQACRGVEGGRRSPTREVEIYALTGGERILSALRFHCLDHAPACTRISYSRHHIMGRPDQGPLLKRLRLLGLAERRYLRAQGDVNAMLSSALVGAVNGHCIYRPRRLRRVLVREACHHHDCSLESVVSVEWCGAGQVSIKGGVQRLEKPQFSST